MANVVTLSSVVVEQLNSGHVCVRAIGTHCDNYVAAGAVLDLSTYITAAATTADSTGNRIKVSVTPLVCPYGLGVAVTNAAYSLVSLYMANGSPTGLAALVDATATTNASTVTFNVVAYGPAA
jgi:hypothetical protein